MSPRCPRRAARALRRLSTMLLASILFVEIVSVPVARADDEKERVQAVEELTNRAYELVAARKYSEAIAAYMKTFDLSKAGAILFNIATIYDRKLHERALAIEYFRRYLQASDAEPELARRATERLSALKAEEAEAQLRASAHVVQATPLGAPAEAPAAAASAVSPPRSPSEGAGLRRAGLVIGGVGLVGAGVGLVLGALAKSKSDEANHYCDATSCFSAQGVTLEHRAGDFATASTVAFLASAGALVIGATMYIAAPRGGTSSASITVSPNVSANGGGALLRATF